MCVWPGSVCGVVQLDYFHFFIPGYVTLKFNGASSFTFLRLRTSPFGLGHTDLAHTAGYFAAVRKSATILPTGTPAGYDVAAPGVAARGRHGK